MCTGILYNKMDSERLNPLISVITLMSLWISGDGLFANLQHFGKGFEPAQSLSQALLNEVVQYWQPLHPVTKILEKS